MTRVLPWRLIDSERRAAYANRALVPPRFGGVVKRERGAGFGLIP